MFNVDLKLINDVEKFKADIVIIIIKPSKYKFDYTTDTGAYFII